MVPESKNRKKHQLLMQRFKVFNNVQQILSVKFRCFQEVKIGGVLDKIFLSLRLIY